MRWLEGKIELENEKTDIAAALLTDFGIEGVEIVDEYENKRFIEDHPGNWDYVDSDLLRAQKGNALLKFYLTEDEDASDCKIQSIGDALVDFGRVCFTIVEDDWSETWKQHYKPFKVGKNVVIAPVWEDYMPNDGEIIFRIDPGHVFGTGQHQSTALCIVALEKYVTEGANILDIGCGSGILSIISLLLGANTATAVDIDPSAEKVCLENARHNQIPPENLKIFSGNILTDEKLRHEISQNKYQVIVANIIADVIIQIAPIVKELLVSDGVFVAGGIIRDRRADVLAAAEQSGFIVAEIATQDEWVTMVMVL